MAINNMACPNCGKQATEYDEDKWQCLYCGNKFVYKPEISPVINTTTNINVGSPLYDIEVGTTNNKPVIGLWTDIHNFDDDPEFYKLDSELPDAEGIWVGICCTIFALFVALGLWVNEHGFWTTVILFCIGAGWFSIIKMLIDSGARKQYLIGLKTQVATEVFCPHCKSLYDTFPIGVEASHHLTHCKKCGIQFLMDGINSYCVKYKNQLTDF